MSFNLIHRIRNKIRVQKNNTVTLGKNLKISGCTVQIKGKNNRLVIGDNIRLRNVFIQITGKNNLIEIGSKSVIGRGSYISAREKDITLSIGEQCSLSRNIKLMTSDGHSILQDGVRINHAKNITLENNVWIADSVTVLKGVTIGQGTVIGINSTVTKDIPAKCVGVGNPCRVVKENITKKD